MSTRILRRWGFILFLTGLGLVAGCSTHSGSSRPSGSSYNPCRLNQASCNYNGQYEPGERDYAEQEAKRLNRAEVQRLKRGF
ncbi:MAG: hypothetical protein EPN31_06725 [Castellaniella sp.]|uniref:hypothetical protein n=1 Tax=Castellaniella sp. TaxID=1955812 RepID=UPI00122623B6|nr:hypothetical protein [Castellaniella sp.]TAN29284.1 MAG: hypothetical protein EPN31_06725 [Castellaniella sp.]